MFEKEAMKDYKDNLAEKVEVNNESRLEEQFEDTFIRGAICGYNKANEWHSLKENPNDLPTENMKQVIVMTNFNEYLMGWYSYVNKTWWSSDCPDPDDRIEIKDNGFEIKVIKWKEIE